MNRTTLLLLLLLVGSNAWWFLSWPEAQDAGDLRVADPLPTATALEDGAAQATEPSLIGWSETGTSPRPKQGLGAPGREEDAAETEGPAAPGEEPLDAAAQAAAKAAAEQRQADAEAYAVARAQATATLKKVMQVEDPALRQQGLAEMAAALAGNDPKLIEYTLSALYSLREVEAVDTSTFLLAVQQQLDSADGGIRRSALYALCAVSPEGVDRDRLLQSASDSDPRVRSHIARLLALTADQTLAGRAATTTLRLLSDEDPAVRRGTLRGLADTEVTPELADRLIQLAADSPERGDAIYFGLSNLKNKSRPIVDALLTYLEDADHNIRARAHWGLQRQVAKDQQSYVAQRYAARLDKFLNPKSQTEALKVIVHYGDDLLAPELERFAANEMVDADVRALARQAAEILRTRGPR